MFYSQFVDSSDLAPERYDDRCSQMNGVFLLGLVRHELLIDQPAFSKDLMRDEIVFLVAVNHTLLNISELVLPSAHELRKEC
jgi:hypothetical protein